MDKPVTAKMVFERETKGAVRFQEVNADGKALDMQEAAIGTLYVRKSALGGTIPQSLTITIQ